MDRRTRELEKELRHVAKWMRQRFHHTFAWREDSPDTFGRLASEKQLTVVRRHDAIERLLHGERQAVGEGKEVEGA